MMNRIPTQIAAILLFLSVTALQAATTNSKPNFIVVFCDNLGYGDIEPFGSAVHRTPNLNRMAREGRKFTHFCVTAGVCTPSRASLMTGCYAQRVGLHLNPRDGHVLRPISPYGLHPDEVTIAEVLKAQGYATAIVGKWHLGDQPQFLPTRQGFDWFFGVPYSDDMTQDVGRRIGKRLDGYRWPALPLMENETVVEAPCDRNGLTKRYTERAMQWIAEHKDEPFFLYFPQAMPGSTKTPFSSPAFKGKSKNGPWGDAIEELDWSLGVMLDQLVELGIAERTFVIWTSDNGAPIDRDPADLSRGSNRPLHGRGYTTSEGAFRVPTIVWQPGKVPAGTVCDELASTLDLLPTFARLAGGGPPPGRKIDGHDISPLLFGDGQAKTPHAAYYYYHQDQLQAVRSGPWKMFLPVEASAGHPHFQQAKGPETLLFHLVTDVSCRHNVAAEHPDVVAQLTRFAEQARHDLGDKGRAGTGQRPLGRIEGKPQPQLLQASQEGRVQRTTAKNESHFEVELQTVRSGYDRKTCWVHTRAGRIPGSAEGAGDPFSVVMTMHELRISGSDVYYPIHDMRSDDGGRTWTRHPASQAQAFGRRQRPNGVEEGISDFWPVWHAKTGVLLGTGHTIRYIDDNLQPHPRPRDTAYSVYDPKTRQWAPFKMLETPDDELFFMDGAGSTQRVDLENGEILLPTYAQLRKTARGRFTSQNVVFVMRCSFDGKTLKYIERGNSFTRKTGRGFAEPSLIRHGGRYLMTLRNDEHNYVTSGKDGLHFDEPRRLSFDDGKELGSYNTQTHWLTLGERVYLVYTRRGADNDHIFRHRAPLFMAECDPQRLHIIRHTERVIVPERGARLGNFGVTRIHENESWVTVAEWMQSIRPHSHDPTMCEKHGSNNSIFVAKIRARH